MATTTLMALIQDIYAMDEELRRYEARYGLRSQYHRHHRLPHRHRRVNSVVKPAKLNAGRGDDCPCISTPRPLRLCGSPPF